MAWPHNLGIVGLRSVAPDIDAKFFSAALLAYRGPKNRWSGYST